LETLSFLKDKFPERKGVVVKELTKIFEKVYRGTIKELYDEIKKSEIKGEYVILIEGEEKSEREKDLEILESMNLTKQEILEFMTKKYKGIKNIIKRKLYEDINLNE